jgi:hypothetical protein
MSAAASAQAQDTTPPKLVGFRVIPGSMDVGTGPQTVTFTVPATDGPSGYQEGAFQLLSPSGRQSLFGVIRQLNPADYHDGRYQTSVVFPRSSEPGAWRLVYLKLDDPANHSLILYEPDLNPPGVPATVGLISTPDEATPPKLLAVTVTPAGADVGRSAQAMTMTVRVADDLAGFQSGLSEGAWRLVSLRLEDLADRSVLSHERDFSVKGTAATPTHVVGNLVDTLPDTTITAVVDGTGTPVTNGGSTSSAVMVFTFEGSSTIGISGFECSLDSAAFITCYNSWGYSNLAMGSHIFQVRAVDTAGAVDPSPASFTWTLATPAQSIQDLIDAVNSMGLPKGVANSLTAPLGQASAKLDDKNLKNDVAACNKLDAFINQVNAKGKSGQLTPDQAGQLLEMAYAIKANLGCRR